MKLSKNDPAIKLLRQKTLDPRFGLPDAASVAEAMSGPTVQNAVQIEWQDRLTDGFNVGTQFGAARIVSDGIGYLQGPKFDSVLSLVGVPEEALMVGQVFTEILEDTVGAMLEASVDEIMEVLEQVLDQVLGAMVDVISGIPVFGWVVKIVWNVVRGIIRLVEVIKGQNEKPPEKEYPRALFTPDGDLALANHGVLRVLNGYDWTNVFMPPGVDRNTTYGEYFRGNKLEGGGRRIETRGEKVDWIGMIPGTTSLHQYIEVEPGGNQVRDTGSLLPSARNLSTYAWAQVTDLQSPSMYSVGAEQVRSVWSAYLFNLRMWIRETGLMKESTKRKLVNSPVMVKQFGWGPYDMPFDSKLGFENFGIDDPTGKIKWTRVPLTTGKNAKPAQTGVAHPVRAMKELEQAQWRGLNTLQVAYVDERQGAFQGFKQEDMLKRLVERRKQLLQHPALCDVNMPDVVDPKFRSTADFHQEEGRKGTPGYPNCVPVVPGTSLQIPSLPQVPGPFRPLPKTAHFNPVPSDAPQYIDAIVIGQLVNGAKKRKKEGRPSFIREYGVEMAATLGLAAAAGAMWRYRGKAS